MKFGHGEHVTYQVWTETGSDKLRCRPDSFAGISQVLSHHPKRERVPYFECLRCTYLKTLVALTQVTYCFGTYLLEVWHDLRLC